MPRSQWFWVLLPKQKGLVVQDRNPRLFLEDSDVRRNGYSLLNALYTGGFGGRPENNQRVDPPQRNTFNYVAEDPNSVDHTFSAGSFGLIHALGLPAGSARAVADAVHADVETRHQRFPTTSERRRSAVVRRRTVEDSDGAVRSVARDPPQIEPRHCLPQAGNIQRIR